MRTVTDTYAVYSFDEWSDRAKENARDWAREHALDYDWWEFIYDAAENIELKIEEFDLDRSRHAKGELLDSPSNVCAEIIAQHGKTCSTYKLAAEYFEMKHNGKPLDVEEFTRALLEEYSVMLQQEYEYRLSDEAIDEDIRANEYEFLENGKVA